MKKITNKMVRAYISRREGVRRVKITRQGEVHAYGDMPRGDGGKRPWWQYVGTVMDICREMTPNAY